jgi:hypothetical protein
MTETVFAVQCDWLTLATFKFSPYSFLAALLTEKYPQGWKHGRWLQYEGKANNLGIFYGHATQSGGREHYILKISGNMADVLLLDLLAETWIDAFYATRIDIQKTRSIPKWWKPRDLYDWLKIHSYTTSIVQSTTGTTLYIGNRQSGRFTRIYEKDLGEKFLRFEIELKRHHAHNAFDYLKEGSSLISLYYSHLLKIPFPEEFLADYLPSDAPELDLRLKSREIDQQKQIDWLKTLVPKFRQMANDHDIGPRVRDIFTSLAIEEIDDDDIN